MSRTKIFHGWFGMIFKVSSQSKYKYSQFKKWQVSNDAALFISAEKIRKHICHFNYYSSSLCTYLSDHNMNTIFYYIYQIYLILEKDKKWKITELHL